MKCRFCKRKAIIRTPRGWLCEKHFLKYYEETVKKTIEEYNMFKKDDRILVCVSGGKDSMALAYVLNKLGYNFDILFINLRIPNFSEKAKELVEKLAKRINKKLIVVDIKDYGIDEIREVGPRKRCSVCGVIKRYIMNKVAYENNYAAVVTGHNLSDEFTFMLLNLYGSTTLQFFLKQGPVIERKDKLVKKVKPLYFLTEEENELYCKLNNIEYLKERCPYSVGNTQRELKKVLKEIDKILPCFAYNFVKNMLKLKKYIKIEEKEEEIKKYCKICGFPTESKDGICSFCKIREYLSKNK